MVLTDRYPNHWVSKKSHSTCYACKRTANLKDINLLDGISGANTTPNRTPGVHAPNQKCKYLSRALEMFAQHTMSCWCMSRLDNNHIHVPTRSHTHHQASKHTCICTCIWHHPTSTKCFLTCWQPVGRGWGAAKSSPYYKGLGNPVLVIDDWRLISSQSEYIYTWHIYTYIIYVYTTRLSNLGQQWRGAWISRAFWTPARGNVWENHGISVSMFLCSLESSLREEWRLGSRATLHMYCNRKMAISLFSILTSTPTLFQWYHSIKVIILLDIEFTMS